MNLRSALWCSLSLLACFRAEAAPLLRLAGTDLRPVWIQTGTNGPNDVSFEAYNLGDGSLNLQVRGSHSWLTPAIGASRACSFEASRQCRVIQVLFSASALAAGTYDGFVIVSDTGAIDAPQRVAVRIYVGTNVPERFDFYLPPEAGVFETRSFQTPRGPSPRLNPSTQTGGNWLAVSSSGMGSFQFLYTHKVTATVQPGMAAGDYNGAVAVSNSSFGADNRQANATLHVTTQPIARAAAVVQFQAVQGSAAQEQPLPLTNAGRGTLTPSGATTSGGAWLTAALQEGVVRVRANPADLAPGFYSGSVSVASNAANNPLVVPVTLEVQAASAPITAFQGVVDAASFDRPVGGGALASLFGSQLATATATAGAIPLPTTLSDTRVFVNEIPAPLIFVSPGQINFQMPFDVSGTALVRVDRLGQRGNTVSVAVARRGPGLYGFPGTTFGIVQNASLGNALVLPNLPLFAGVPKVSARPGDFLVLYGSGLGPVSPAVAAGAAAGVDPLSRVTEMPRVSFGRNFFGPFADPLFVGLTPGFVGLYQVNVQVLEDLPANPRTPIRLDWPDGSTSNTIEIPVER